MEVEYSVSTGKQVLYGIFAAFLAIIAIVMAVTGYRDDQLALLLPAIIFAFLTVLIGGQIRKKVTISVERVVATNALQTKELATADIKGCRINEKVIVIEPTSADRPKITINNYLDFTDGDELKKWLRENFKDLDATDLAEEKEQLLNDGSLGATKEEREAKLTQSKWIGWSYMAVGTFSGLMCIPFDRKPAVIIYLSVYPLIGILVMALNKGLIKFLSSTKRSVYSFIAPGLFTPAFVLCLTGSLGYDIYDFHNAFLPAIVIGLISAGLIYITGFNKDMPDAAQVIGMVLVSAIYGFGCVVQVNCLFDKSAPRQIHTTINSKSKNYNKREHYYLDLNPFSPGQSLQNTEVSESTYDKYNAGDNIEVDLKKGLLNIPWYYLPDEN
jgi:hypothetical protein